LAWRQRWPSLDITLVRGNHDTRAGDPPPELRIHSVNAPNTLGDLTCAHEPPALQAQGITLCGHLHPTIALSGRGDRLRLSCFVLGPHYLILPAFSAFTGSGAWEPGEGERAFAIVGDEVHEVPVRTLANRPY
jgi:metallophosphoesterase superfamily enzyme